MRNVLTMDAVDAQAAASQGPPRVPGYRRRPRRAARPGAWNCRRVADDLAETARSALPAPSRPAAGTTTRCCSITLTGPTTAKPGDPPAASTADRTRFPRPRRRVDHLSAQVRAIWPGLLVSEEAQVLDQAIGLALYDSDRYQDLGREASKQYLPSLLSICPPEWPRRRKLEVARRSGHPARFPGRHPHQRRHRRCGPGSPPSPGPWTAKRPRPNSPLPRAALIH